ncbi:uncharacterized protein [Medicago truncatula]|uniref:uncharacterized protein n=1 Tax=Medicago truncatula TaxID=3880 RepID=UPI00196892FE|nr:uncharacterized protein LOC112416514 [Medicago truncatula]
MVLRPAQQGNSKRTLSDQARPTQDRKWTWIMLVILRQSSFHKKVHTKLLLVSPPHRSRLHWTTLEALMCARSWLWSKENNGDVNSQLCNEFATLPNEIEPDDECEILASGVTSHFEE